MTANFMTIKQRCVLTIYLKYVRNDISCSCRHTNCIQSVGQTSSITSAVSSWRRLLDCFCLQPSLSMECHSLLLYFYSAYGYKMKRCAGIPHHFEKPDSALKLLWITKEASFWIVEGAMPYIQVCILQLWWAPSICYITAGTHTGSSSKKNQTCFKLYVA